MTEQNSNAKITLVMRQYDEARLLLAETKSVVLALSAEEGFSVMREEDVNNVLYLIVRQLERLDSALKV